MKVYFTSTQRAKDEYLDYLKKIYSEIQGAGYQMIDDDLFTTSKNEFFTKMEKSDRKFYEDFYKTKMKYLHQADICVFESTVHSLSMGFFIQKALELNKPTILLHYKEYAPFFLIGSNDDKLIIKSYTEKNIKKVVREALEIARERRDKRFNFFISPKLLDYLEKSSHDEGVTKSKFIRNLIVNKMRKEEQEMYGE